MLGKIEGRRRKGTTEDEMVGWHHKLNGLELKQALGDGEGQGSLVCFSPWGRKKLDRTGTEKQQQDMIIYRLKRLQVTLFSTK